MITLRGFISSGKGVGKLFVLLPWFKENVKEKLGFEPFPGTLNVILSDESAEKLMEALDKHGGFEVPSRDCYLPGRLYKAFIAHRIKGAIVRPKVQGYPKNLIEIIAPVCLKETLALRDGDEIEIEVFFE